MVHYQVPISGAFKVPIDTKVDKNKKNMVDTVILKKDMIPPKIKSKHFLCYDSLAFYLTINTV